MKQIVIATDMSQRSDRAVARGLALAATLETDLLVLGLHRPREFMDSFRQTTMERIVGLSRPSAGWRRGPKSRRSMRCTFRFPA